MASFWMVASSLCVQQPPVWWLTSLHSSQDKIHGPDVPCMQMLLQCTNLGYLGQERDGLFSSSPGMSLFIHLAPSMGAVCFITQSHLTLLQPSGLQPARLPCPWDFPGKNTGVGCHFLLQGIFLTQGWNPHLLCLLHCRRILYPLSHQGSHALKQIHG